MTKYGDKLLKYLKGVMKVQIKIIHLEWMINQSHLKALPNHKAKE